MRKAKKELDESKLIFNLDAIKTSRFPTRNAKNNYSINLNNEDIEQNSVSKYLALYTKIGNNELIKLIFWFFTHSIDFLQRSLSQQNFQFSNISFNFFKFKNFVW